MHNRRVSTISGLISVLLLITTLAGFILDGYQKVYAIANVPTSDLATKIRDSTNAKIRELVPPSHVGGSSSIVELTLTDFPRQTSESFTRIELRPSCIPLLEESTSCTGFSKIVIPGIGTGLVFVSGGAQPYIFSLHITVEDLPGQTEPFFISLTNQDHLTRMINIPGIGSGRVTVQLLT